MHGTFEDILTAKHIVSAEQLEQIKRYAENVGIDLHEAVLQQRNTMAQGAAADTVMLAYSESVGLPFVHIGDMTVDENVTTQVNAKTARHYGIVPFAVNAGFVQVFACKPILPDAEEALKAVFNLPVKCLLCLPNELNAAVTQYFPQGNTAAAQTSSAAPTKSRHNKPETQKPLSDEETRSRLLSSIVAFNFSVFFICTTLYYLQIPRGLHNTPYQFPVLALCGIIGGSVAAFITWKKLSVPRK
ncbi:MAG: hypothetical protein LBT89_07000 [Planctomycetaceae bacterium]|jgi:hypothetical protein|nr:hypothetical protein [Planctomycetaceae bacterium]